MEIFYSGMLAFFSGVALYFGWLSIGYISKKLSIAKMNEKLRTIADISLRVTIPIFCGVAFILVPIEILIKINNDNKYIESIVVVFLSSEILFAVSINYLMKAILRKKKPFN